MSAFIERQKLEIKRARELHGNVNSAHEGYAVILEELDEFWEEVRKKIPDKDKMIAELVQIAAMCQKTAEDVCFTDAQKKFKLPPPFPQITYENHRGNLETVPIYEFHSTGVAPSWEDAKKMEGCALGTIGFFRNPDGVLTKASRFNYYLEKEKEQ
jgi:hypothetical protein